ncbi:MAG: hypothetical protein BroJett040_22960 [Oligoflexia bacterium]|nr:MAG: hypothetical protein BroJett040_22960 [Oligoflexia bacterium]
MRFFIAALISIISVSASAETGIFEVDGMHCKMCVRKITKTVCALEEVDQCEVEIGRLKITTKSGAKIDVKKITDLVAETGSYKVIKSEIKP